MAEGETGSARGAASSLWRRFYRELVVISSLLIAVAAAAATRGEMGVLDGLLYDAALSLHSARPGTRDQPVVVVAVDHASLESDELAPVPRVFFGPFWATMIDGLMDQGAKAIGFDIIFSFSADRFPAIDRKYDAAFRDVLGRHAGHLVLARSAGTPVADPLSAAVFDIDTDLGKSEPSAIAFAELTADADGVQRRITATIRTDEGDALPTLPARLLERAGGPPMPEALVLAPREPLEQIPTYGLASVLRCLRDDPARVAAAFGGKIVLVGTSLPEEDRKRAPDRFMPIPEPPAAQPGAAAPPPTAGCDLTPMRPSDPDSNTVPGVFLHAAAVEAAVTGAYVVPINDYVRIAITGIASIVGSVLGFALAPWAAVIGVSLAVLALFAGSTALIAVGGWLTPAVAAGAVVSAMLTAYVTRFLLEERRRRRVQRAFSHYLAPSVVDSLVDSEAQLHLGGEVRDVTIMFADLSGFTALSGRVGPGALMEITNRYLTLLVEAVEATGGYVDKFIGDAVMAIWGAPVADPRHAVNAARGALAAVRAVERTRAEDEARGAPGYSVKIGLNSGPAVVGNVGAPRRYNYTAVGETVNVASRLEAVPGDYGCRIVLGPETAAAVRDEFVLCELDWLKVKGKRDAIAVYELLSDRAGADPAEVAYAEAYCSALHHYRAGAFEHASRLWRGIVYPNRLGDASPPLVMAERCEALDLEPPASWDGIWIRTSK